MIVPDARRAQLSIPHLDDSRAGWPALITGSLTALDLKSFRLSIQENKPALGASRAQLHNKSGCPSVLQIKNYFYLLQC